MSESATSKGSVGEPRSAKARVMKTRLFLIVCISSALVAVAVLVVLLGSILWKGWSYLTPGLIANLPSRNAEDAGLLPAIAGSIYLCMVCAAFALPIGIATALLLEEFPPNSKVMRTVRRIIELNITNLAGVPSVVYGIIGLTAFASMYGQFGSSLTPRYTIGQAWYDQTYDESRNPVNVPVAGRDAPINEVKDGLQALSVEGESIVLRIWTVEQVDAVRNPIYDAVDAKRKRIATEMPNATVEQREEAVATYEEDLLKAQLRGVVLADALVQRVDEKAWYYVQLPLGRGVLAGGLTLMLVVLPIIITVTQEALRAVPDSLREGALACGATRWQMVWKMTLPASMPGIMTGSILAMSRAIGEAAPVLIICGIVFIPYTPGHLMDNFTAMPLQILNWINRPSGDFHEVAAAGIIVLLAVLLSFNALAILIRQKFNKPLS